MSRPPLNPDKTLAGITLDPHTLERVVPESRRPDGSVRKQLKIRPGFTPQEDVKRFRGTKQAQLDANALPKGHIIGWVPPPSASSSTKPMSKSAKKNAKRKEKKEKDRTGGASNEPVPDNWDDDEMDEAKATPPKAEGETVARAPKNGVVSNGGSAEKAADDLIDKLEKLDVK